MFVSLSLLGCASGAKGDSGAAAAEHAQPAVPVVVFDADSAYAYVSRQVEFGPRVPGSEAHRLAGDWLSAELRRRGAAVTEQRADLTAFDGTRLPARNILGRFNTDIKDSRLLLLAHWDCRPWADKDSDPEKRLQPVDGANDGASGVGVILEICRHLAGSGKGVDVLFVDAEDWGSDGDEESWALGARYFMENLPVGDFEPSQAILLDMVGGEGAVFAREYFSEQAAPDLNAAIWSEAAKAGYGDSFQNRMGGAVTDDHLQMIDHGIPAIDIIEYNPSTGGFNRRWHTSADTMEGIDRTTLKAVGQTVVNYIFGTK